MPDVHAIVDRVFRAEAGRLHAALIRALGDFERAEDALQDALAQALRLWPERGVPEQPAAWLYTTARNRGIDHGRRAARFAEKQDAIGRMAPQAAEPVDPLLQGEIPDERLRLVFTCCHPALKVEAQIALTLRTLCGLTTPEIARAFLVPEATMAQRLVRAQRKIQKAGIPYRVPPPETLPERIDAVLHTLYLVFNEGYAASGGDDLIRHQLCDEAIRLARLLDGLLPERGEVEGLLSLMELHHARRAARLDPERGLVSLEEQDRGAWDQETIQRAAARVEQALRRPDRGPYAIQAAIAALHCVAPAAADTDWPQILGLYRALHRLQPTPVVALNATVALAMVEGVEAGLRQLAELEEALAGYPYLPAARADLLRRAGRSAEAAVAYRAAVAAARTAPERQYLERRLAGLSPAGG